MTVTYGDAPFIRLLFRWRGSVWKQVWKKYLIYLVLFFAIQAVYRFAMPLNIQVLFERMVLVFDKWSRVIPIQFLLGFYVSSVVARWWDQLNSIAWPDKLLLFVTTNLQGKDPATRQIRRTFARWSILLSVLVWKEICLKIKKRFPTDEHLRRFKLMTEEEFEIYQNSSGDHGRWFLPVSWMANLIARCYSEGRIGEMTKLKLIEELYAYRGTSAMLTIYDWINIPLVYTQLATIATYGYFMFTLISRQSLEGKDTGDILFPFFTTLEFVFYFGWLSVAEELRMPFGEGDEDFDMNYVLDRNVYVANMLVDELHDQQVQPTKDIFWDTKAAVLPHTKGSYPGDKTPAWRLSKTKVKEEDMKDWDEIFKDVKVEEGKTVRRRSLDDNNAKETHELSEQEQLVHRNV